MLASLRRSLKRSTRLSRKPKRRHKSHKKPRTQKSKRVRSVRKGKAKKMNPYMVAVQKARKSGASSFRYGGKTYKRYTTKTGMDIYKK